MAQFITSPLFRNFLGGFIIGSAALFATNAGNLQANDNWQDQQQEQNISAQQHDLIKDLG